MPDPGTNLSDPARGAGERPSSVDSGGPFPSFLRWETLLSLVVTVALLGALATQIDFDQVWSDLAKCSPGLVLLGALAHYATYPVRGLRWRRSLGELGQGASIARFGLIVFFYNAVDNVVPAKLGDLYAAHLARLNFRVRRSAALGSIVFLRLVDAWCVFVLAGISSWFVFHAQLPDSVAWVLGGGLVLALLVTGVLISMVLLKNATPGWVPAAVVEMIEAFHDTMWPASKDRFAIAVLTIVIWTLETLWMLCLALALGVDLSLAGLIFLTQVPLLASAFPLTPAGAGAVEITLYGCLRLLSVSHPLAVSFTVLNRLIDYWLHIVLGVLVWFFRHPLGLHTVREETPLFPGNA